MPPTLTSTLETWIIPLIFYIFKGAMTKIVRILFAHTNLSLDCAEQAGKLHI